jgi:integrase
VEHEIPKGVHSVSMPLPDGTPRSYYYAWRGGPRIKEEPGTKAFNAKFAEMTGEPEVIKEDLSSIIEKYKDNVVFTKLAESTRREYARYLTIIDDEFGDMPITVIDDKSIRGDFKDWRDEMSDRPATADYAWSVLARLMSFALDRGIIDRNPCLKGGKLYKASRQETIWTEAHLLRLFAVASPQVTAAVTFALWTGQRMSDCIEAKWSDLEVGKIKVRQNKGGRLMMIPVAATLSELLATLPRTDAGTILTNSRGTTWTRYGLSCSFRKAVLRSGIIDDLHFHDLRGTAVTRMALTGCTALQIAAVTGHSPAHVNDILENHYLGGQVELAEQAIARLETRTGVA